MRTLTDHQSNECNRAITIEADDPDPSNGASHEYTLIVHEEDGASAHYVIFQKGPINEVGVNGVTNEALLAIVADRLRGFQIGPYACGENYEALKHVHAALISLNTRTQRRIERGVEGTHTV